MNHSGRTPGVWIRFIVNRIFVVFTCFIVAVPGAVRLVTPPEESNQKPPRAPIRGITPVLIGLVFMAPHLAAPCPDPPREEWVFDPVPISPGLRICSMMRAAALPIHRTRPETRVYFGRVQSRPEIENQEHPS